MVLAISTLTIVAIVIVIVVLLLLAGGGVRPFGRVAERMTDQGNRVNEPPGFRKPPDQGGLL